MEPSVRAGDDRRWQMLFTDADEFSVPDDLMDLAHQAGIEITTMQGHDPAQTVALRTTPVDRTREYLLARRAYVPDYRARWRACRWSGSGQVEKANDLLVTRRQKG